MYDEATVGWLFDTMDGLGWKPSVLDVLETERRYPGLMTDLGIEGWQRKLIKDQLSGEGKTSDAELDGLDG